MRSRRSRLAVIVTVIAVEVACANVREELLQSACAVDKGYLYQDETAERYCLNVRTSCNVSSAWAKRHRLVRVLGFVLPWNEDGFDVATTFKRRFTDLSPVWFRVVPREPDEKNANLYEVVGHNWAKSRKGWSRTFEDSGPRLMPHFSIELFEKQKTLREVLAEPKKLALEIAAICELSNFGGAVLDVRLVLFRPLRPLLYALVTSLSQALRVSGREFLLSVPPLGEELSPSDFTIKDFNSVFDDVDGVIVGTRDYSKDHAGPIAPLPWVNSVMMHLIGDEPERAQKLLMEIPLYAKAFPNGCEPDECRSRSGIVNADNLVRQLETVQPDFSWNTDAVEHYVILPKQQAYLSVPSLQGVAQRIQLAHKLGVGVAFRDIGSGFNSMFDLVAKRDSNETSAAVSFNACANVAS